MQTTMDAGGPGDWFLLPAERGNAATRLDHRHAASWSTGNEVAPLIHGAVYFAALRSCADSLGAGD
jgi:hypothetical protein